MDTARIIKQIIVRIGGVSLGKRNKNSGLANGILAD